MALRASILLCCVHTVGGYAEGLFGLPADPARQQHAAATSGGLHFVAEAGCTHHAATPAADARSPPAAHFKAELVVPPCPHPTHGRKCCVVVTARSSSDSSWWFIHPPLATEDPITTHCVAAATARTPVLLVLNLTLPVGFTRLAARYELLPDATARPTPEAVQLVWVSHPKDGVTDGAAATTPGFCTGVGCSGGGGYGSLRGSGGGGGGGDGAVFAFAEGRGAGWGQMARKLRAAYTAVRADDSVIDYVARRRAVIEQASAYAPHRLYPELASITTGGSGGADSSRPGLERLLHPDLIAALKDGSPAAVWRLLRGTDHTTECSPGTAGAASPACSAGVFTFPVFTEAASLQMIAELEHAKDSPVESTFSIPNNIGDDVARTRRSGIVLDELGWGSLAAAVVKEVLAPLAQVLHPQWAPWDFDSYHAFSIHVGGANSRYATKGTPADGTVGGEGGGKGKVGGEDGDEGGRAAQSSRPTTEKKKKKEETVVHQNVGDQLPFHIDVCECSVNICLGEAAPAPAINGSAVYFGSLAGKGLPPKKPATPGGPQLLAVQHVPGRAFINLCQMYHGTDKIVAGTRHSLVVRAISSHIRKAPAELFYEQCIST